MVHAVGDGDAGREAVVDEPAGARGAHVGEQAEQLRVFLGLRVHRHRELALDAGERGEQLVAAGVAEQHDDRAEVLLEQRRAVADRGGRRLVGGGLVAEALAVPRAGRAERLDLGQRGETVDRGFQRVAQALVEQHGRVHAVELRATTAAKSSPAPPAGTSTTPGFVQSCPPKFETEATRPSAIDSARVASAASVTTIGLTEPISA